MPTPTTNWTTPEAAKAAGCSTRQIQRWAATGLVVPRFPSARPGCRHGYTFRDLVALRAVATLRREGASLQAVRKAVSYVLELKGLESSTDALAGSVLLWSQRDVLLVSPDAVLSTLKKPGQSSFRALVLSDLSAEVSAAVKELQTNPMPRQRKPRALRGVDVAPECPTIRSQAIARRFRLRTGTHD